MKVANESLTLNKTNQRETYPNENSNLTHDLDVVKCAQAMLNI